MKSKGEAHEALSLLFQQEGVPPSMVMDGSKEQNLGKFHWKLVDAHCQLKQTEPYSPWQNVAEREIKELKKGLGRKMLASSAPRRLWDDCFIPTVLILCTTLMVNFPRHICPVKRQTSVSSANWHGTIGSCTDWVLSIIQMSCSV